MKKEFNCHKINRGVAWETIEFEIQEKTVKILMMKKLIGGKMIYNEMEVDKREFTDFCEEVRKDGEV